MCHTQMELICQGDVDWRYRNDSWERGGGQKEGIVGKERWTGRKGYLGGKGGQEGRDSGKGKVVWKEGIVGKERWMERSDSGEGLVDRK